MPNMVWHCKFHLKLYCEGKKKKIANSNEPWAAVNFAANFSRGKTQRVSGSFKISMKCLNICGHVFYKPPSKKSYNPHGTTSGSTVDSLMGKEPTGAFDTENRDQNQMKTSCSIIKKFKGKVRGRCIIWDIEGASKSWVSLTGQPVWRVLPRFTGFLLLFRVHFKLQSNLPVSAKN